MKKLILMVILLQIITNCLATQYVVQFDSENNLIKSYEVTEKCPIRASVPEGRIQLILTNTNDYEEIERIYTKYGREADYIYDDIKREININTVSVDDNSKIIAPVQE